MLEIARDENVTTLWLNRPDALNAMGRDFWADLPRAVAVIAEDDDTRCVVVAARGRHFCVGLDLKEMAAPLLVTGSAAGTAGDEASAPGTGRPPSRAGRAARLRSTIMRMQAALSALADCPKPVVAAVHGYCIGGGVDLVSACDIRLASSDAVFSIRETRLAMVADLGTLQRLPKIIGSAHVAEMAFTGMDVDAARAKEIGLVNDVFDDHEALLEAARSMASEIASLSPLAVQGTKAALAANDGRTVAQGLEYAAAWNAAMLESEDLTEAVTAFFEKRPPRFTGR